VPSAPARSWRSGEITLRACPAILKRDQHWQMSNAEAKRLEPRFAEAGDPRAARLIRCPGVESTSSPSHLTPCTHVALMHMLHI